MSKSSTVTESDILDEIVRPGDPSFPPDAARSILELTFSERATERMRELSDRNNQGALVPDEESELACFRRVGLLIDLLQAKARLSLKNAG